MAQYHDCVASRQVRYDPGMPRRRRNPLECDNRLLARARQQPHTVYDIAAHAMLTISSATPSIQEDYIRGQDQLILPGAEVIGRRIIGTLVPELGPK